MQFNYILMYAFLLCRRFFTPGNVADDLYSLREASFDSKFLKTFPSKGETSSLIEMSKRSLSNLMGGLGYFYGKPQVHGVRICVSSIYCFSSIDIVFFVIGSSR